MAEAYSWEGELLAWQPCREPGVELQWDFYSDAAEVGVLRHGSLSLRVEFSSPTQNALRLWPLSPCCGDELRPAPRRPLPLKRQQGLQCSHCLRPLPPTPSMEFLTLAFPCEGLPAHVASMDWFTPAEQDALLSSMEEEQARVVALWLRLCEFQPLAAAVEGSFILADLGLLTRRGSSLSELLLGSS